MALLPSVLVALSITAIYCQAPVGPVKGPSPSNTASRPAGPQPNGTATGPASPAGPDAGGRSPPAPPAASCRLICTSGQMCAFVPKANCTTKPCPTEAKCVDKKPGPVGPPSTKPPGTMCGSAECKPPSRCVQAASSCTILGPCPQAPAPMCVPAMLGPCHKKLKEMNATGLLSKPMPGLFVPQCTVEGEFKSKQCHGSTGYCWCVNSDGERTNDKMRNWENGKMLDCECKPASCPKNCSSQNWVWKKDHNGCHNCMCKKDLCHGYACRDGDTCVDLTLTYDRAGMLQRTAHCVRKESCQHKLRRTLGALRHVPENRGLSILSCHPNNTFKAEQHNPHFGVSFCVDETGKHVTGTTTRGKPDCTVTAGATREDTPVCATGIKVHHCDPTRCHRIKYPGTKQKGVMCRINPCGGCKLEFYNSAYQLINLNEDLTSCQKARLNAMMNLDEHTHPSIEMNILMALKHINTTTGEPLMKKPDVRYDDHDDKKMDDQTDVSSGTPTRSDSSGGDSSESSGRPPMKPDDDNDSSEDGKNTATGTPDSTDSSGSGASTGSPDRDDGKSTESPGAAPPKEANTQESSASGSSPDDSRDASSASNWTVPAKQEPMYRARMRAYVCDCDDDGEYAARQCYNNTCWCMSNGRYVEGTAAFSRSLQCAARKKRQVPTLSPIVCSNNQAAFKCVGENCTKQTCGPANMSAACFNNPCRCPESLFKALTSGTVKPCPVKKCEEKQKVCANGGVTTSRYFYNSATKQCEGKTQDDCASVGFMTPGQCSMQCAGVLCDRFQMCNDVCSGKSCPLTPRAICITKTCSCGHTWVMPKSKELAKCDIKNCPILTCDVSFNKTGCQYGLARDKNGCPKCECGQNPCLENPCPHYQYCSVVPFTQGTTVTHLKQAKCNRCVMPSCTTRCQYGMKRSLAGCMTCDCHTDPCKRKTCPSGHQCKVYYDDMRQPYPKCIRLEGPQPPNGSSGPAACDGNSFIKMGECTVEFIKLLQSYKVNVTAEVLDVVSTANSHKMSQDTHTKLCEAFPRLDLSRVMRCYSSLCPSLRTAMNTTITMLNATCKPSCKDYTTKSNAIRTCTKDLKSVETRTDMAENICNSTKKAMDCSWTNVGDCLVLKLKFNNIFNDSYIGKLNTSFQCKIKKTPEQKPGFCMENCVKNMTEKVKKAGVDMNHMMSLITTGKVGAQDRNMQVICRILQEPSTKDMMKCVKDCESGIPMLVQQFTQMMSAVKKICHSESEAQTCEDDVSSGCLGAIDAALKDRNIAMTATDFPALMPGQFTEAPVAQSVLTNICSATTMGPLSRGYESTLRCLMQNRCSDTLKMVNKTGTALEYICKSDCKDSYLSKAANMTQCISGLDSKDKTCSDIVSAMKCALSNAEGCSILEHFYKMNFTRERIQKFNKEKGCSIKLPEIEKPKHTCPGGKMPLKNRSGQQIFCGHGPVREDCPDDHVCKSDATDKYGFCCPKPQSESCKEEDSAICFIGIATALQTLRVTVEVDNLPKLSPAEPWDRPPISQQDLNTLCSSEDNIKSLVAQAVSCLRKIHCVDMALITNKTGMLLQHICMEGCKDNYVSKAANLSACIKGIDARSVTCRDATQALKCAHANAKGCGVLEHFMMKNFTKERLQKINKEKPCNLTVPADKCSQPAVTGICEARFTRWYFDKNSKTCKEFIYGGCGGNENRFTTKDLCESACKIMVKPMYTCAGGKLPLKNRMGKQIFCGRGPNREDCPDDHLCKIGKADEYAFCCPKPKPCKQEESARCYTNIATTMLTLGITVAGNDLSKLSPAEPWDRAPISQKDLNTICSNGDDIEPLVALAVSCLRTIHCVDMALIVNKTGMLLQHICMEGCKDNYVSKAANVSACIKGIDARSVTCRDATQALKCAHANATGCGVLEHFMMKNFTKERLQKINKEKNCNLTVYDKCKNQPQCRMRCKFGFKMGTNGCEICQCKDSPCKAKRCDSDEVCQLKDVQCVRSPCPPIAHCVEKDKLGTCPKPKKDSAVGICIEACSNDSSCKFGERCCSNGCGHVCVKTAPSAVEGVCTKKKAESLKDNEGQLGRYVPQCMANGQFAWRQCHQGTADCWCVDSMGKRRQGSDHKTWDRRQCGECPVFRCAGSCSYGRAFNNVGCQTCGCKPSPCQMKDSCKSNQVCRLEKKKGCTVTVAGPSCYQTKCIDKQQNNMCPDTPRGTVQLCPSESCPAAGCGTGLVCCPSGCKNSICLPAALSMALTACEKAQDKAKKMLALAGDRMHSDLGRFADFFIPNCKTDGSYNPTQCKPFLGICHCVDKDGKKIARTTKRAKGPLDCSSPKGDGDEDVCAEAGARPKVCSNLMELMTAGCPAHKHQTIYRRINSCGDTCTVDFYDSRHSKLDCQQGLTMCEKMKVETKKKMAAYMTWMVSMVNTGKFKIPTEWNKHVADLKKKAAKKMESFLKSEQIPHEDDDMMESQPNKCHLPKVTGRCRAYFPRWAYNRLTMKCEMFIYGGCGANENNFESEILCKQSCSEMNVCEMEKKTGNGTDKLLRFFYNEETKSCDSFIYSGEGGNVNNFRSRPECEKRCHIQPLAGMFMPKCDNENKEIGGFTYKQCLGGLCLCLDASGKPVTRTSTRGKLICDKTGRDIASSSPASACRNGASPKDCLKTCMTAMCHGVDEAVTCHADPCNNCAITFMGLVSKTEVRCKSKMADQGPAKPAASLCAGGGSLRQCAASVCDKPCASLPEASCRPDPCSCKPIYYVPGKQNVQCSKLQPLCLRQRAMKIQIRSATGQNTIHVPECDRNGKYQSYQCTGPMCWCVDATGMELPNTRMTVMNGQTPVCRKKAIKQLSMAMKINVDFDQVKDDLDNFKIEIVGFIKGTNEDLHSQHISVTNIRSGSIMFDVNVAAAPNDTETDLSAVANAVEAKVSKGDGNIELGGKNFTIDPSAINTTYTQVDEPNPECKNEKCTCQYGQMYKMEEECRVCECLPNPCSMKKCSSNQVCQVNKNIQCVKAPCNPVAECKDIQNAKCPNVTGMVGICISECRDDSDCSSTKKCCSNGCGQQCMQPEDHQTSICENHQVKAIKKIQGLFSVMLRGEPVSTSPVWVPRCDENGDYKKIQCLPSYGICHCVESKTGKAVHSPNTMIRGMPNCDNPASMKPISSVCEAGETVNKCDPLLCVLTRCRSQPAARCYVNPCGSKCTVEFYDADNNNVDCNKGINKCTQHRDMINLKKLRHMYMSQPRMMLNHTLHYLVKGHDLRKQMAAKLDAKINMLTKSCHQPRAEGTQCGAPSERFYFNPQSGKCQSFIYGGCDGNKNNFESLVECESSCDPHICHQDKKIGSCTSFVRKWFFNKEEQKCEVFDFGGCEANANNFDSESTCMKKCMKQHMYGMYVPQCHSREEDAGFLRKQCLGRLCWCLDDKQQPIAGSLTHGHVTCSTAGRDSTKSDIAMVCSNGNTPQICHKSCLNATCSGHMTNLTCAADPCNDCVVTFYKPGVKAGSWDKVKCDEDKKPMKAVVCPNGLAQCADNCSSAPCAGFSEALCVQNPCDCSVKFVDIGSKDAVNCDKIAGICSKQRVYKTRAWQMDPSVMVPVCSGPSFQPQQCHGNECWCVNDRGLELKNTRKTDGRKPTCEKITAKSASVQVKIAGDCNKVKSKQKTFNWNFMFAFSKILQTEMKNLQNIKLTCGSIIVDFEVIAQDNEDLASKLEHMESQVRKGNVKVEHEGEILSVDRTTISVSLDYTPRVAPTTEVPPSGDMKQTIIIAVVAGVIGLMLIIAVVLAIIKSSPKKPEMKYHVETEGYSNAAYDYVDKNSTAKVP